MLEARQFYLFLLPTFIMLGVFAYYPPLSAMYHAFFQWSGATSAKVFVGFENFALMLQDEALWIGARNLLIIAAIGIPLTTFMPLVAAELIFNLATDREQRFFRLTFLIPTVVPAVVYLLLWKFIYDPTFGLINTLLTQVGLERWTRAWLGDPNTALFALIFKGFPWVWGIGILIYYAGLQGINTDVIDASRIDGCSRIRRILQIDIPSIMGQVKFFLVTGTISTIQGYEEILIMTRGGPGWSTTVPGLSMYINAFDYNRMGYASAIGVALFGVILLITIFNMTVIKAKE